MTVVAQASPSLALIKYWGKLPEGVNLPTTSSLAMTLGGLRTTTRITPQPHGTDDEIVIGGRVQPAESFRPVIDAVRSLASSDAPVRVQSENTFPTASGIASSSSGFAALAIGLDRFYGTRMSDLELSAVARLGSGSASRAVYGGFTVWRRGAESAEPLYAADYWPELRVVVVVLRAGAKPVSSRDGMNRTSETSTIYDRWVEESRRLFDRGTEALAARDLQSLGTAMRESYLLMFSTMFTAKPPIVYWQPESVAVIHEAQEMRTAGIPVWETMDAGPQVKLLTLEEYVEPICRRVRAVAPDAEIIVATPGGSPAVEATDGE